MKKSKYIRLTKINSVSNPITESSSIKEYNFGGINSKSLPIDYWLEGYLEEDIKVGTEIHLDRRIRNNVKIPGYFLSTTVQKIENDLIFTMNSIYRIQEINQINYQKSGSIVEN